MFGKILKGAVFATALIGAVLTGCQMIGIVKEALERKVKLMLIGAHDKPPFPFKGYMTLFEIWYHWNA